MITFNNAGDTPEARVAEARAFMESAIADGRVALDPNGTCLASRLYDMYVESRGGRPMGKKNFGIAMTALGSPGFGGNGNVRMRGGIRILTPAPPSRDTWIKYQKS